MAVNHEQWEHSNIPEGNNRERQFIEIVKTSLVQSAKNRLSITQNFIEIKLEKSSYSENLLLLCFQTMKVILRGIKKSLHVLGFV